MPVAENTNSPNRIDLDHNMIHEEYPADAALSPGHLVMLNADGEVLKHATSGGPAEVMVAKEDALQGKTINDAYAAGDPVAIAIVKPGERFLGRLPAAATAVVRGNFLMSNGDGCMALRTSTNVILAVALEPVDNSAGSGEVFIRCRRI